MVTTDTGTLGSCSIELDGTTHGDYDGDFTTEVSIDASNKGDIIRFAAPTGGESVLVGTADTLASVPISWQCPAGMIEMKLATQDTGAITWYMKFVPLDEGVTVTAQ